jgi:hypothetical protein
LSTFDEQREFTILEGAMACELAKSHLFPLHQRITIREYVTIREENAYEAAMLHIFHRSSHHVTEEEWNEFLNKMSEVKKTHRMHTQ